MQKAEPAARKDLVTEAQLNEQSATFLKLFSEAAKVANLTNIEGPEWASLMDMLADLSRSRSEQGFSPSETATFVFSFKQPLFDVLRREAKGDAFSEAVSLTTIALDKLGLYTTEVHLKSREEIISRQQQELIELSTPVVELWEGILGVPLIGTLDSTRTRVVMEGLLHRIAETRAEIAIIDITGVPTIDTQTAQHLIRTAKATRLMGTDCIVSGIRPIIAQTMVQLGVDLGEILTQPTLAGALAVAFKRRKLAVIPVRTATAQER